MTLNRKFLSLLTLLSLLFLGACDPNEELYDELDKKEPATKAASRSL
ncbi:hypothetical protein [Chloroherpeton thalassium]|nr:hypothetical protein [Chloroherpeton thalassium]